MNKKLKVLASAITVLMVASTLVGCGSSSSASSTTKGGQTLTIWSQYQGADLAPVKKVADAWAKKTGNTVKVVEDKAGFDSLTTAVKSSKGPDIELGVAQDHIGTFVNAGIAAEVPSGTFSDSDYLDSAVKAVTYKGKEYAVPCLVKTYALFYNKDLVSNPPKTWDDLVADAKTKGLALDPTNFYFDYALLSGNGAYVFKMNSDGTPNTSDIGLGNDGAVKGFTAIKQLVDDKILSASDTGDIPKGKFTSKKAAYYISGTWDVGAMKTAGINYGVVTFPQINGKAVPTFASIDCNVVSATSKNKALAFQFLKDTSSDLEKALFEESSSIPALKSLANSDAVQKDPITAAFAEQDKSAEVMGNYPEFGTIWTPGANVLKSLVAGKSTPQDTAKTLVDQVKQGVASLK